MAAALDFVREGILHAADMQVRNRATVGGAVAHADPASDLPPMLIALDGPVERAELFWRLSVPISALVLTLLAIPLGYVNPRMGRSFNLIAAAFLYMIYSNCLNIVQSFIAQDKLGFLAGLLLPHAIAVGVVLLLFGHQLSLFGLLRRPPRAKPA